MAEINKAPRGTNDILPGTVYKWQFLEKKMLETAALYGYKEIRTPIFEHTEVFHRSVGDTTDVVQKEMYTFEDKGGRSITLRPELTAGVVRAVIEHGEINNALPVKTCYVGSCYRYEKPQAGRLREFHQFGVECFGAGQPAADAEIISLAKSLLSAVGITDLSLEINSIGCPECRKKYNDALKQYFTAHSTELCATCNERLERNPMRILDCKSPVCGEIAAGAPVMLDYLCEECSAHFQEVQAHLQAAGIDFSVNPKIVRGLDYYTKTVFEFISGSIGAQSTVCGGGRYDGLVAQMGGPQLPALGFAMGMERILMVAESNGIVYPEADGPDVYIAPMGHAASLYATELCARLREEGFSALTDISGRGLKAQMKYANKCNVKFTAVLGDDELANKKCKIKNMATGAETETDLEAFVDAIYQLNRAQALQNLENTLED
ncbi:MAG: histidine--tRNA ligase [Clostridia bacterium]|nr:histidine--tRNA ligase [Clostridia bacterium]